MKKLYTLSFILLASVFAGNAQNLVTNPTFATGLTGWTAGPTGTYALPTSVTTDGSDDTNSVQYVATATTGFYQEIAITGGRQLVISFWYKSSGDGTDSRIWSNYKDATDAIVYQDAVVTNDPLRTNNVYLPNAATWTKQTITVTSPANATKLVLAFRAYNGGTVSFDQMSVVQTVLSVKQNTIAGLNVYPNPVTDGNLYITSNSSNAKTVVVYDILGKQVLESKTSNSAVNVSTLKGGAYIVRITEDGKTDTKKVIIQ
ncbi:MAG: T9SS type A sorting domain-containing protein [Flavobacterium sp.]|nr:T9SS type A sorting domain-containing protein [Flavobacterium sp.]